MDDEIRTEMLKLASGERILRFEHQASGLCLEKRLEVGVAVVVQKERWKKSFTALLSREVAPV